MNVGCCPDIDEITDDLCNLEDAIADLLPDGFTAYTGGVAKKCQTGQPSPSIPYAVLQEQPSGIGERHCTRCVRTQVIVRLRLYTKDEYSGVNAVKALRRRLRDDRCMLTNCGLATYNWLSGRPRSLQAADCLWMTQANLAFWVLEPVC